MDGFVPVSEETQFQLFCVGLRGFYKAYFLRDPITERQRMSKGWSLQSPPKRKVSRFHETILSFGDWIPLEGFSETIVFFA